MPPEDFETARRLMVDRLERQKYYDRRTTADALRAVPRHEFVPEDQRTAAYDDRPLPIGDGQTISAPHMVAMMVDLLELQRGDRVLEIGTGCGYHAAVTAEVVGSTNVFSVEVSPDLATSTRDRLDRLGYGGISIRVGDGAAGWAEHAPYDAAYFTCAVCDIPEAVIAQLSDGGRVFAPVGRFEQELIEVIIEDGAIVDRRSHGGVRFVQIRSDDR